MEAYHDPNSYILFWPFIGCCTSGILLLAANCVIARIGKDVSESGHLFENSDILLP